MTLFAALGKAQGLDATEVAVSATDKALNQIGRHDISLALIAASHDFPVSQVVNGVAGLLSDTPLFGFSTPAQLTSQGLEQRSVIVALLAGDQVQTITNWWEFSENGEHQTPGKMIESICSTQSELRGLIISANCLDNDPDSYINTIQSVNIPLAGCLAGGDISGDRSYQIGGSHYGPNGFATTVLKGKIRIGVGANHGWQSIGVYTHITSAKDNIVHSLDGHRAVEIYSKLFGFPTRDWSYPPLNHLIRIYPLGVEREVSRISDHPSYLIHSPLKVEIDGSLRMNNRVPQDRTAYILVSSVDSCLAAAKLATQQALDALGDAEPILALVFADIAWQMIFQAQPGAEIQAIQEVLGSQVPIIGGYTFGQINLSSDGTAQLLNQHLQIVIFGNPSG